MATPTPAQLRARIVSYWTWGIAHEPQIHYRQARPMEDVRSPSRLKGLPRWADCSEFVTDGYAYAGAPDPNGRGYDGQGYTGTLLTHGKKISQSSLLPGDIVVFGRAPGVHVCGVLSAGKDPLLASHGQERGPIKISLSAEKKYHAGETVTCLRALPETKPAPKPKPKPKPKPEPTRVPISTLRKRTGFFSWLAWCLNEGDWKGYGKRNPIVRPHVAKKVSVSWWARSLKFLAARKEQK